MFRGFEGVKGGVYGVPEGQGGSMGVRGSFRSKGSREASCGSLGYTAMFDGSSDELQGRTGDQGGQGAC